MELWQYYRILRKRKWLIIIGTLICVGIVVSLTKLTPEKHRAYTTVMEKLPSGDDKVSVYNAPYLQIDSKMRLSNLIQIAKSESVLRAAFDSLRESGAPLGSEPNEVMRIMRTLDVQPVLDTMVLNLSVVSTNKTDAEQVVAYIRDAFIQRYNELSYGGMKKSREFIESQLPEAKARFEQIQQELSNFKEQSGAVMLPQQTQVLLQQLAQFETNLSQYEVQANQASARIRSLESRLDEFPETRRAQETLQANPVFQQLQMELAKQQIELQKMLQDRTPAHPEVQALQEQVLETERKLKSTAATIVGAEVESVNPLRDNVVQNYLSATVEFASADAARKAAAGIVTSIRPKLETLPKQEARLAELRAEEEAARNTYMLLRQKSDEAKIKEKEAENISTLHPIDEANTKPADERENLKIVLALILAPILCSGIAFLLNYMDNTVKTPVQAEELLQMPVFAAVPLARAHSLADSKCLPAVGMSYQMLSANLWIKSAEMDMHTILVASAEPNVGRSVTATNLAVTLARDGARVILVDSDLRQPSLHTILGVDNEKGLSNVLAGQLALRDALTPTNVPDLMLITSGPLPANPVRLLRSAEMENLVAEINDLADFVIFDSPAGITFADSTLLAALVKNVVLVYAAGTVPRGAEAEFRSRLEEVHANFLGAVLSMVKPEDSHGYYHFRSAYGELLRNGKAMAALPGSSVDSDSSVSS